MDTKFEKVDVVASTEMSIFKKQVHTTSYDVFMQEEIKSLKHFVNLFDVLIKARENDVVNLHMNCNGGHISTGLQLIHHMRSSQATVVVHAEGPLYSMAPLVALAADELKIADHVFFMFHDYRGGFGGAGHEVTQHVLAYNTFVKKVLDDICGKFLSAGEIKLILGGTDIYVHADDIQKRLANKGKKQ